MNDLQGLHCRLAKSCPADMILLVIEAEGMQLPIVDHHDSPGQRPW
jgi:hypothetical protein